MEVSNCGDEVTMSWFKGSGGKPSGGNDNTSPGYDKARENFDKGKSPSETRKDLDDQKRQESVKPVEKK
jgi:hypothetical protein